MRLLVITQKLDKNDSNLGFFHVWLERLAARVEHLYVICLEKGEHSLPAERVTVLSLGKEEKRSRREYLTRFYRYIWRYRRQYDHVFVHMNPEYVVLGGLLWRLLGKKVLLWYVHKSVDWKLQLAEKLATKIFTASRESFRLPSRKVAVVGHGIVVPEPAGGLVYHPGDPLRLLTIGRIAPTKDLETIIMAVGALREQMTVKAVSLDIFGAPITAADQEYAQSLGDLVKRLGLESLVQFRGGVSHAQVLKAYEDHHIFVHTSRTGSLDKAALEALAAGLPVVTSSAVYGEAEKLGLVTRFSANNSQDLAKTLEKIAQSGIVAPNEVAQDYVRRMHNLDNVVDKLVEYFVSYETISSHPGLQ